MQTLTRRLLLGLAPLAFGALVGAGVVAAGLERTTQEVRVQEAMRTDAAFLASLAADPSAGSCLRSTLTLFLASRPELAFASLEAADGSVLGAAGDEKAAAKRSDRTLFSRGVPVRVRLGYRTGLVDLGGFVRVAIWLLLCVLFTVAMFVAIGVLLRRSVVRPLEELTRWASAAGPLPESRAVELQRLAAVLEEREGKADLSS